MVPTEYAFCTPARRWPDLPLATHNDAGKKGAGLLGIPPRWYPATLVISPTFHREIRAKSNTDDALSTLLMSPPVMAAIRSIEQDSSQGKLLARSSAVEESIRERGKYVSVECSSHCDNLSEAVKEVWANRGSIADSDIGVLIQPLLAVQMRGHLSNEHRLSRDSFSWTTELEFGSSTSIQRWRVTADDPSSDEALTANTPDALIARLRGVASRLARHASRYHLEWVWDGKHLWIVQADQISKVHGPGPGEVWREPFAELPFQPLDHWRSLDEISDASPLLRWNKIASLVRFRSSDLPTARLWVLQGEDLILGLVAGSPSESLLAELELLTGSTLIIRTDVVGKKQELMLTKCETKDANRALEFLRATSTRLVKLGVPASSICFLAHRYIAARACAWSLSKPNSTEVIIHSTWGLLDGLGWLPHDVFHFDVDSGELKARSVEGKSEYLDADEDGVWSIRSTPTEWIWRSSMSLGQIRLVAEGARRLAATEDKTILTMWFIDLLDESGIECLPWITHTNVPLIKGDEPPSRPTPITVRSTSDLDEVDEKLLTRKAAILELHPGSELVRDRDLIDKVIQLALRLDLPVQIIGSPLGHPYYLLSAAGVRVTCRQNNVESQTAHGKIVRDTIPDIIERNGESASYYKAVGRQREKLFRVKVLEEAMELFRAKNREQSLDEMADLEEIVSALRREVGISKKELTERMGDKRAKRGGFSLGLVLNRTSSATDLVVPDQPPLPGMEYYDERVISWQVKKEGGRLLLNYIPPITGHRSTFTIGLAGMDVRIKYLDSHIEIEKVMEVKGDVPDALW